MESPNLSRRSALKAVGLLAGCTAASPAFATDSVPRGWKEARDYEKLPDGDIKCVLCPKECVISHLERGYCGARENRNGVYYTAVYGLPVASNVDPVEKKPLYHFHPGTNAFSIATTGCNIHCKFCQNWRISQIRPEQAPVDYVSPQQVAQAAIHHICRSIAYTYTEPVVFNEYVEDCALQAHELGIANVTISNGYIRKKPLRRLCKSLSAMKIDLKSFREKFYREICSGELKPVLDSLVTLKEEGLWCEIVVLLIPTLNDGRAEIRDMCRWIVKELGADVPLHFSRFHPQYRMKNLPPTPPKILDMAWQEAKSAGIRYAYVGNLPGHRGQSTHCHHCGKRVIWRYGYWIKKNEIKNGKCGHCVKPIPGVWA